MVDAAYMLAHCRGELGRQKPERCPRSWLLAARKLARQDGDTDMAEACTIALSILRGELPGHAEHTRRMARLTGRKAVV